MGFECHQSAPAGLLRGLYCPLVRALVGVTEGSGPVVPGGPKLNRAKLESQQARALGPRVLRLRKVGIRAGCRDLDIGTAFVPDS